MGTKKRKESSGMAEPPPKKSKKSKSKESKEAARADTMNDPAAKPEEELEAVAPPSSSINANPSDNVLAVKSKQSRKRAADFMDEEDTPVEKKLAKESKAEDEVDADEQPALKKSRKVKKSKKGKDTNQAETLTADGVNGVIEKSGKEDLETATSHKPVATSMQAEAERTVEHELEDEFGGSASDGHVGEDDDDDNAGLLLAGFDSDTEDKAEDSGLDLTQIPPLPMDKKALKKLKKAKAKDDAEGPGAVYVGRIPHGFYEKEMREYFSQFGEITQLRLSRNKRTGASKHFAFIEFSSTEVAKIVAETMDNYLMFGHILKCKYAAPEALHPDVWKGANKKFRKIPHDKLDREKLAQPKTEGQWQKKVDKEQRKRDKKAEKMRAIGLEMPSSALTSPVAARKRTLADKEELKAIDPAVEGESEDVPVEKSQDFATEKPAPKETKVKKSKKDKSKRKIEANIEAGAVVENEADGAVFAALEAEEVVGDDDSGPQSTPTATATEWRNLSHEERHKMSWPDRKVMLKEQKAERIALKKIMKEKAPKPSEKKAMTKPERRAMYKDLKGDRRALQAAGPENWDRVDAERQAQKKAAALAASAETSQLPVSGSGSAPQTEVSADFISLGDFADEQPQPSTQKDTEELKPKLPPWKEAAKAKKAEKKAKKERKNLVKARGPKSGLVSTKGKSDPAATGRMGLPVMGKGKYDKATRQANKKAHQEARESRGTRPNGFDRG